MIFLLWFATILLLIATLVVFATQRLPPLKNQLLTDTAALLSPFVFQYMITSAGLAFLALSTRPPAILFYSLFLIYGLCMFMLWPYFLRRRVRGNGTIKILQANVLVKNQNPSLLKKLIGHETPDIVIACEVNTAFAAMFHELLPTYPQQKIIASDTTSFGLAILSKHPLENIQVSYLADSAIPAIFADAIIGAKRIHLAAVHTENPLRRTSVRDLELEKLKEWAVAKASGYALIAGDLNATPYCAALYRLTKNAGLRNARENTGLAATFPAWSRATLLQIPIDHVLVSQNIQVDSFQTAENIGSDHLPTLCGLSFKPAGF